MKVILDTNVFVSAIFWGGKPRNVLQACLGTQNQIVVSEEILEEYSQVIELLLKKYVPDQDVHGILDFLIRNATVVETVKGGPITADPNDDMFFEAAIASGCKMIVSGDKHLLERSGFEGISVLTAAAFLQKKKD